MAITNEQSSSTAGRELIMTRTIDAPRELVYKVWTDPQHVAQWWGPNGFTNTIIEMDVRPGGTWLYTMHAPDGTDFPNKIVYSEVVKAERLVYVHSDGSENDPKQFDVTITFEAEGNKTKLTMRSLFGSAETLKMLIENFGVAEGGNQTLNRLEAHLVSMDGESNLVLQKVFNAPQELVFRAWTEAEHLAHWWGPKGMPITVAKLDFSPGGVFHYSMQSPDGNAIWGKFVYREIIAPTKITFVSSFADANCGTIRNPWMDTWPLEVLNVMTLTEQDGKTTLTLKGGPIHASETELAAFNTAKKGMEQGFSGTFEQLEAYLAGMAK